MGSFADDLYRIADEVRAASPQACSQAMEHVKTVAVEKAPEETGDLRGSAEVKPHDDGSEVYFPGPYARYQEYGVSRFTGKPLRHEVGQSFYLVTSIVQEAPKVFGILAEELSKVDGVTFTPGDVSMM